MSPVIRIILALGSIFLIWFVGDSQGDKSSGHPDVQEQPTKIALSISPGILPSVIAVKCAPPDEPIRISSSGW